MIASEIAIAAALQPGTNEAATLIASAAKKYQSNFTVRLRIP